MQRSTLTLSVEHTVLVEGERSTTIPTSGLGNRIMVEIQNSQGNRSRAQSQMARVKTP